MRKSQQATIKYNERCALKHAVETLQSASAEDAANTLMLMAALDMPETKSVVIAFAKGYREQIKNLVKTPDMNESLYWWFRGIVNLGELLAALQTGRQNPRPDIRCVVDAASALVLQLVRALDIPSAVHEEIEAACRDAHDAIEEAKKCAQCDAADTVSTAILQARKNGMPAHDVDAVLSIAESLMGPAVGGAIASAVLPVSDEMATAAFLGTERTDRQVQLADIIYQNVRGHLPPPEPLSPRSDLIERAKKRVRAYPFALGEPRVNEFVHKCSRCNANASEDDSFQVMLLIDDYRTTFQYGNVGMPQRDDTKPGGGFVSWTIHNNCF